MPGAVLNRICCSEGALMQNKSTLRINVCMCQTSTANTTVWQDPAWSLTGVPIGQSYFDYLMTRRGLRTAIPVVSTLCDSPYWPNHCPDVLEKDCIREKQHKLQKALQKPGWKSSKSLVQAENLPRNPFGTAILLRRITLNHLLCYTRLRGTALC